MGKRGRAGKPANLKILEGNPGNRPLPENTVDPHGDPVRPDHLSHYGAAIWDLVVAAMPEGVYKSTDTALLATYCQLCETQRKAIETLRVEGEVIRAGVIHTDPETGAEKVVYGPAKVNPWQQILNSTNTQIVSVGTRLGLDPIARESIKVPEPRDVTRKFDGLAG